MKCLLFILLPIVCFSQINVKLSKPDYSINDTINFNVTNTDTTKYVYSAALEKFNSTENNWQLYESDVFTYKPFTKSANLLSTIYPHETQQPHFILGKPEIINLEVISKEEIEGFMKGTYRLKISYGTLIKNRNNTCYSLPFTIK